MRDIYNGNWVHLQSWDVQEGRVPHTVKTVGAILRLRGPMSWLDLDTYSESFVMQMYTLQRKTSM